MLIYNTEEEMREEIRRLSGHFELVRLVDPVSLEICFSSEETGASSKGCTCYSIWGKNKRCTDCSSAYSLMRRERQCKIEAAGGSVYFVISNPVLYGDKRAVLEMVATIDKEYAEQIFDAERLEQVNLDLELGRNAMIDELTGIYNRRGMDSLLEKSAADAQKEGRSAAIILLDIDYLKLTNDTCGYRAGDELIIAVADTILKNIRSDGKDMLFRYGGDQFVCYLDGMEEAYLKSKLQKILGEVSQMRVPGYEEIEPSISAGAVLLDGKCGKGMEAYLEQAEKRRLMAKKRRNCAYLYEYIEGTCRNKDSE